MRRKSHLNIILSLVLPLLCAQGVRAQWVPTNGPGGGDINSFHVCGGTIFTTTGGRTFISTDRGVSWSMFANGLENENVYTVTGSTGALYAGTENGIYRSTDSGASWTLSTSGIGSSEARPLAADGNTVIAESKSGVYLSANNGTTWNKLDSDSMSVLRQGTCFAIIGKNIIAVTNYAVFHSSDNGRSWTTVRIEASFDVQTLMVNGNRVFACSRDRMLFSDDGGISWAPFNAHDESMTFSAVTISKDSILAINETGVYLSPVEGGFWRKVHNGGIADFPSTSINCLCAAGTTILAGTKDEGIYRSVNNGRSWVQSNQGLRNTWVITVAVSGNTIVAKCPVNNRDRIFISDDNGTRWTDVSFGLPLQSNAPLAVAGSAILAGPLSGSIYRFDVNAATWETVNTSIWYAMNLIAVGRKIYSMTSNRSCYWTDNGISWTEIKSGISEQEIECLAVAGDTIMAKTEDGIFVSTDNWATWVEPDANIFNYFRPTSFAVIGNTFFAGSMGVFRSSDLGKNWTAVNTGLPQRSIQALVANGNSLYASDYKGGVFHSVDKGDTWNPINTGLIDSLHVVCLAVHNGTIFAGTTNGVWRRPLSDLALAEKTPKHAAPAHHSLNMAVSGTAGSNASIAFSLPRRELVALSVYDMCGRVIQSISGTFFEAGSHTLRWDTRAMPAGCYLVKMSTGQNRSVKKFTLLR